MKILKRNLLFAIMIAALFITAAFAVVPGKIRAQANVGEVYAQAIETTLESDEALKDLSVWESAPYIAMPNLVKGLPHEGFEAKFKMLWNRNFFYVLVCTNDVTEHAGDQIEVGYMITMANYYCASYDGTYNEEKGNNLMSSVYIGGFVNNGLRYMVTRHAPADKSVLDTDGTLKLCVKYWDFDENAQSGDGASCCKYSWQPEGVFADINLKGTPAELSEEEKADLAAAKEVEDKINALPEASAIVEDDKAAVEEATAAYKALTETQKEFVSAAVLAKLTAAQGAIEKFDFVAQAITERGLDYLDSNTWKDAPFIAMRNVFATGAHEGIETGFKLIWDYDYFYLLVCTNDNTVHASDQIEINYSDGSFYRANVIGTWTPDKGMNCVYIGHFEEDDLRYMVIRHEPADKSMLSEGNKLSIGVRYLDFVEPGDTLHCRYTWQVNGTCGEITFKGTPAELSEEEKADLAAAKEVEDKINALPAASAIVEDDKAAVEETAAAYETLTANQKLLVSGDALSKLDALKAAIEKFDFIAQAIIERGLDYLDLTTWQNAPFITMRNVYATGAHDGIESKFKLLWDRDYLYILVCTNDDTVHESDQIEMAYSRNSVTNYYKAHVTGSYTEPVGSDIMTSAYIGHFENDGLRYMVTRHMFADRENVLVSQNKVLLSVRYQDHKENGERCCIYSWNPGSAVGEITLKGTPAEKSEEEIANETAAKNAENKINALPAEIAESDKEAVDEGLRSIGRI